MPKLSRQSLSPRSDRPAPAPSPPAKRHGQRFALLGLACLLTLRLPLPWVAVALVFAVLAEIEGVRACLALRRERRGGFVASCIAAMVIIGLFALGVASTLALYPLTYQRQECLAAANTDLAKAQCTQQFDNRINRLQGGLLRS